MSDPLRKLGSSPSARVVDPGSTEELSGEEVAHLLYEQGFLEQALVRYEKLARRYPRRGDLRERVEELRHTIERRKLLETTRPIPPQLRADLMASQGYLAHALEELRTLQPLRPDDERLARRIQELETALSKGTEADPPADDPSRP